MYCGENNFKFPQLKNSTLVGIKGVKKLIKSENVFRANLIDETFEWVTWSLFSLSIAWVTSYFSIIWARNLGTSILAVFVAWSLNSVRCLDVAQRLLGTIVRVLSAKVVCGLRAQPISSVLSSDVVLVIRHLKFKFKL